MKKPSKIVELNANLAVSKPTRTIPSMEDESILKQQEERIEKNLKIGKSLDQDNGEVLLAIRQRGKFPDKTFEAYVKRRWQRNRDWAYKSIDEFKIVSELPGNVLNLIQNQNQVLALKEASPEDRAGIIESVAASGKVTGDAITKAIEKKKRESKPKAEKSSDAEYDRLDKTGFAIPRHLLESWDRATVAGKKIYDLFASIVKMMKDNVGSDPSWCELTNNDNARIRSLANDSKRVTPHSICSTCEGVEAKFADCDHCKGRGFFSKFIWDLVPDKQRRGRE